MEPPRNPIDSLTPSQRQAIEARGNVLVMAGAGTGKTKTLVGRCLDCLERERVSLDELLIVTFTEAAAAELRQRLRKRLEEKAAAQPAADHWPRQLALFDIAHIGTLHSFCLRLVREHFHELGLDPQLAILDQGEARQRATETLTGQFQAHYEGEDSFSRAVQSLVQIHGGGRDERIRALILRLHHYSQARPDAAGWLAEQVQNFSAPEPADWLRWLLAAIEDWCSEWLPVLENLKGGNEKAAELTGVLQRLQPGFPRELAAEVLEQVLSADDVWPAKKKTLLREPLEDLFEAAAFFAALARVKNGDDPLVEDWTWVRGHMETLLRLTQMFAGKFAASKLNDGVLDFHDLEQFALKLLWDFSTSQPTAVARLWREKLRFIFVDEYQDINAAQDKIIAALSRNDAVETGNRRFSSCDALVAEGEGDAPSPGTTGQPNAAPMVSHDESVAPTFCDGASQLFARASASLRPSSGNRFLVGDVKQSIYRFRLADPKIFRDYARDWHGKLGRVIPLSENFRSREALLHFTNAIFAPLMREELGGVTYDADAQLKFGAPATRAIFSVTNDSGPRAELLLRFKTGRSDPADADAETADGLADLGETEKEARMLALRLKQLQAGAHPVWDDEKKELRPAQWRDMAVLLRAMSGKSEVYALEFERAGVPLVIARRGFYDSSEISDLLSLLQLLDNPLQDIPCIAVLRSPLVGLSLDELAGIRLSASRSHFWTALAHSAESGDQSAQQAEKVAKFLARFARWRKLARQTSLSRCLEQVLAETHYAEWLRSRLRGPQRQANVGRFLNLAQQFDQFQRQGLFRFLKFIEAQRDAEAEPEVASVAEANAVRLMSIHQSKGLEFPVVAVADLARPFNQQDRSAEIIFDEELGLCPRVKPPQTERRYPSLPHWLAQRHQRREQAGEELRLLYVALTRARDTLILSGSIPEKKWMDLCPATGPVTASKILSARSCADWLGLWFAQQPGASSARQGELPELRWRIVDDAELKTMGGGPGDEAKTERKSAPAKGEVCAETSLPDEAALDKLRTTLTWQYGFDAATKRAAKSSVTALRRQAADELDDEAEPVFQPPFSTGPRFQNWRPAAGARKLSAADAGTAHHTFLQHIALEQTGSVAALEAEAARMEQEKILSADERAVLNLPAMAALWRSAEGQKIRAHPAAVKHELKFTAKFSPAELAEIIGSQLAPELAGEFVVVQGVADLVVLLPAEIWLLDFKTDDVSAETLPAKIQAYEPQLKLYARALGKIYSRPVTHCWLHFLAVQRTWTVKL